MGSPVWTKSNTPQKGWVRGEFKINRVQYETFQVSFEAANPQSVSSVSRTELKFNFSHCFKISFLYNQSTALDDIRFLKECSSQSERFCDFETDLCGYTTLGSIKWKRGSQATLNKGPVDQTTGTKFGSFIYVSGTTQIIEENVRDLT